jgi:hypothetical protein
MSNVNKIIFTHWLGALLLLIPFIGIANDLNSGGQAGVLRTLSASTLGYTGLNIGGAFKYATGNDYIEGPVLESGAGLAVSREAPRLFSGNMFAAYGLMSFIDISMDLPVYSDITGWGETVNGVGDLDVALKLAFPGQLSQAFLTQAYYLDVIFPTGEKSHGFFPRHSYYLKNDPRNTGVDAYSVDAVFFNPMLVWTLDFSRLRRSIPLYFHANLGGVVAKAKSGSAVVAALALEIKPARYIALFTELTGESRVKYYTESFSIESFDNDPFRLTPGFRLDFPGGFYCLGAGDIGFSDGQPSVLAEWDQHGYRYATRAIPKWAAQVVVGWNGQFVKPDRDKDGIPDQADKCPEQPEDRDGFQDADGCPDRTVPPAIRVARLSTGTKTVSTTTATSALPNPRTWTVLKTATGVRTAITITTALSTQAISARRRWRTRTVLKTTTVVPIAITTETVFLMSRTSAPT